MFSTSRLILRGYNPEKDKETLYSLFNNEDAEKRASLGYIVPTGPKHMEEEFLAWISKSLMTLVVETKPTPQSEAGAASESQIIGYTELHTTFPKNRDATFGIMLLPQFWGKGFGTEISQFVIDHAFKWLALHRVSLGVLASNTNAKAMYQRV
jgi:RimJ/RimL family protein N-acetyltransferase